jgi:exonuclease I
LAEFLLPEPPKASYRNTSNRWDIIQLIATCFSLCTSSAEQVTLSLQSK